MFDVVKALEEAESEHYNRYEMGAGTQRSSSDRSLSDERQETLPEPLMSDRSSLKAQAILERSQ